MRTFGCSFGGTCSFPTYKLQPRFRMMICKLLDEFGVVETVVCVCLRPSSVLQQRQRDVRCLSHVPRASFEIIAASVGLHVFMIPRRVCRDSCEMCEDLRKLYGISFVRLVLEAQMISHPRVGSGTLQVRM